MIYTPGMRIECRDAEWLVTRVDAANGNGNQIIYCLGADDLVRGHEAAFLSQLEVIRVVDPKKTVLKLDDSNNYMKSRLFLEAQLRQMPLTDPYPHVEGMGAFQPMQYQTEVVERALSQLRPRLLLADAVGLGKTIEVGMILSEMIKRGQADRILVLAKKSMLSQFQAELWNRFAIPLIRMDSAAIQRLQLKIPASKNPFEVYQRLIISIDTLKDVGRYSHFLENVRWDMVVIDEAHNVSGGSNPERHLSYRLARRLARRTNSMILTTATPHNGKRETFGRLISLLDPSAIPDPDFREYDASDIAPFFMMRFKEDVRAEAGDNFGQRRVIPLPQTTVEATEAEEAVYQQLAKIRQAILDKEIVSNAIVQWGMYKSFLSSPEACLSTAKKRLAEQIKQDDRGAEIPALRRLVDFLTPLSINDSARFKLLLAQLGTMNWQGEKTSPRILLFTESRVTQQHLAPALAQAFKFKYSDKQDDQANQVIATIHGGMSDISLAKTVESFGTGSSPVRLLIATEVASEGVNLHHQCHHIIHYDLPWSIITLIQRNGRIDRFGQQHDPVIRYLMVKTREGIIAGDSEIFARLTEKVEEINRSTRTGESLLKLYDAEKEEAYIASEGLLKGNRDILDRDNTQQKESLSLENTLLAATQQGSDDFMAFLMGETDEIEEQESENKAPVDNSRIRLLSNQGFFEQGYQTLKQEMDSPDWHHPEKTDKQIILTPPAELGRRLGMPGAGSDTLPGATAIPEEAWPEDRRLYLTSDPERVNLAIKAALAQKGQWSRELLLTEDHPVMQWMVERLMMLIPRGEAPLVVSPHLESGELLFCFIGQVSSRAGTPLIVDPHAVSLRKGGRFEMRPLKQALADVHFEKLVNTGKESRLDDNLLGSFISIAVDQSLAHLKKLRDQRQKLLQPRLEQEEQRLKRWFERWALHIDNKLNGLPPEGRRAAQLRQKREEMEKYLQDRTEIWKETHQRANDEPNTRLILVVEGAK